MDGCRRRSGGAGFTLVELLVAVAVTGLLVTASLRLVAQALRAYQVQGGRAEADQELQLALDRLVDEIQAAATVAVAGPQDPACPGGLTLAIPADQGSTAVCYRLEGGRLLRKVGTAEVPVATGIVAFEPELQEPAGLSSCGAGGCLVRVRLTRAVPGGTRSVEAVAAPRVAVSPSGGGSP